MAIEEMYFYSSQLNQNASIISPFLPSLSGGNSVTPL